MKAVVIISFFIGSILLGRTQTQQEIQDYFNEVAYGSEEMEGPKRTILLKWDKNIKMYLDGNYITQDIIEVRNIISELNALISPLKIILVKNKSEANSIVYFGDFNTFNSRHLGNTSEFIHCNGFCTIYGFDDSIIIDNTLIYISKDISPLDKKHTIIEEITQSLGLSNDTWTHEDSMFYEGYSTTQQLSKLDRELIKMLYNDSYAKQ
jgi:hypothetical protein